MTFPFPFVCPRAVGGGSLSLAFRSSTISAGATCAIPTGCVSGDLLVLLDCGNSSTVAIPTSVTPAGFTALVDQTVSGTTGLRSILSYKLATGLETTITGMLATGDNNKIMLCFSSGIVGVAPSTPTTQGTTSAPSNQSILAASGGLPLIVIGAFNGSGPVTGSRAMSPAGTYVDAASGFASLGYIVYNAGPSNNTISQGDTGRCNVLSGVYFSCA